VDQLTINAACRPFGMVNLSPDTDTKGWWNSGYCYHTGSVRGLNHSHAWQLSGPSVMPIDGSINGKHDRHEKNDHRSSDANLHQVLAGSVGSKQLPVDVRRDDRGRGIQYGVNRQSEPDSCLLFMPDSWTRPSRCKTAGKR